MVMIKSGLKKKYRVVFIGLYILAGISCDIHSQSPDLLAKPSAIQYKWHEQERIMFVCLDPCTWQGREYDNHTVPVERINPTKLNTDQWCEAALAWGAKEILFVAKHTGGFCWWQTETTDYSIKNTSYKNGKGDVLKELSTSCKKYELNLGIYVYPGDDTWGAGIGSGGRTEDPTKQEAYNEVFRQQLTEVLANYGDVLEVWFDGSCTIDVSDILEKYAANSVIFQGPHATIRWPGTESGKLFYPAWNTVNYEDISTGVSTQVHGDPNGDVWAPLETNTTLYDHFWFWSPEKAKKQKSLDQLMECYYKSVGYGSVFLLNSTPDTTGLIPEDDIKLYKAFGEEINRRFKSPIADTKDETGEKIDLIFPDKQRVNHIVLMEDYRQGHRVREYIIEGYCNGGWVELHRGQSIGRKKIDYFDEVTVSRIRLNIIKNKGEPLIRSMAAYYVEDFSAPPKQGIYAWSEWQNLEKVNLSKGEKQRIELDISGKIKLPGQYTIRIDTEGQDIKIRISELELLYDGNQALDKFVSFSGNEIKINRTAQVTEESRITLIFSLISKKKFKGEIQFRPSFIY